MKHYCWCAGLTFNKCENDITSNVEMDTWFQIGIGNSRRRSMSSRDVIFSWHTKYINIHDTAHSICLWLVQIVPCPMTSHWVNIMSDVQWGRDPDLVTHLSGSVVQYLQYLFNDLAYVLRKSVAHMIYQRLSPFWIIEARGYICLR